MRGIVAWKCTCTHNMPHTLLRMLLILRPHLLQIFASHPIITGCGHMNNLSTTVITHCSYSFTHVLSIINGV